MKNRCCEIRFNKQQSFIKDLEWALVIDTEINSHRASIWLITHGRCRNKDLLNILNSWTVSDTLNSIVIDKTCFCNVSSFILNLPVYDIQKRKDSVILKEQPFDFMGEWRFKKKTLKFTIRFCRKKDMVTVTYSTLCIRSYFFFF